MSAKPRPWVDPGKQSEAGKLRDVQSDVDDLSFRVKSS